jgi:hypothetical protein
MQINPVKIAVIIEGIQREVENGHTSDAEQHLDELHSVFNVHGDSDDTRIGITVRVHTYEYTVMQHFVTVNHDSVSDAVTLVAEYATRAVNPSEDTHSRVIAEQLSELHEAIPKQTYNILPLDEEIHLDVDAYYMRIQVEYNQHTSQHLQKPSVDAVIDAADTLVSRAEHKSD